MTDLRSYLSRANPEQPNLDALWIRIQPIASIGKVFRCVLIHHLTGAENGGNHNVYVDVLDINGNRYAPNTVPGVLRWTWEGRKVDEYAPEVPFDKPSPEPLGNIPLNWGQVMTVWIGSAAYLSDRVSGMNTTIEEKPNDSGAFRAHQSDYIVFQLMQTVSTPPVIDTLTLESLNARVKRIEAMHGIL